MAFIQIASNPSKANCFGVIKIRGGKIKCVIQLKEINTPFKPFTYPKVVTLDKNPIESEEDAKWFLGLLEKHKVTHVVDPKLSRSVAMDSKHKFPLDEWIASSLVC